MANFRDFLGAYFKSVICIGCRDLPEEVATARGISREFQYYYNDAIPLADREDGSDYLRRHVEKIKAAKADLLAVLKNYVVGKTDVICYPSVDFYSLHALAHCTEELQQSGATVMLRFIGVMETATSGTYSKPLPVALTLLNRLLASGVPVKLAAETPRYAEFLAVHVDRTVAVAANIEMRDQLPLPDSGVFTVICPGSARFDKGFLQLHDIFAEVRRRDPDLKIRFVTQLLPERDLKHHLHYVQRLYAIPGVETLPSKVSAEEIEAMYNRADLVLLPYAADVYEFRGSAVLIEALCSGRLSLALDGPAFIDQMRYFGGGTVCRDLGDMANKVIECSRQSPQLRYAKARQARERFLSDLEFSYRNWVM